MDCSFIGETIEALIQIVYRTLKVDVGGVFDDEPGDCRVQADLGRPKVAVGNATIISLVVGQPFSPLHTEK